MEKKLRVLFEYQRFDGSKDLDALIRETEQRNSRQLSEDELTLVNAAGEIGEMKADPRPKEK